MLSKLRSGVPSIKTSLSKHEFVLSVPFLASNGKDKFFNSIYCFVAHVVVNGILSKTKGSPQAPSRSPSIPTEDDEDGKEVGEMLTRLKSGVLYIKSQLSKFSGFCNTFDRKILYATGSICVCPLCIILVESLL